MIFGQQPNNPLLPIVPGEQWRRIWDSGCRISLLNPSDDVYTWTRLDQHVTACAAKGTKVLYCFGSTPAWAAVVVPWAPVGAYGGRDNLPMDLGQWAEFVTALATRYKGRIHGYELWNEASCDGFWAGTDAQLLAQCQTAHKIIKSIDPAALVLTPSVTWGWATNNVLTRLEIYFQMGFQQYADVVAFHGYLPTGLLDIRSTINGIYALEAKYKVQLPVWDTEFGGHNLTAIPDENKRNWVIGAVADRMLERIGAAFIYQADNKSHGWQFNADGSLNSSGEAWADACTLFQG